MTKMIANLCFINCGCGYGANFDIVQYLCNLYIAVILAAQFRTVFPTSHCKSAAFEFWISHASFKKKCRYLVC